MRKKIANLSSRVTALEVIFGTDTDDEEEQKRRDGLRLYVVIPPLDSALRSFQEVQGRRRKTEAAGGHPRNGTIRKLR